MLSIIARTSRGRLSNARLCGRGNNAWMRAGMSPGSARDSWFVSNTTLAGASRAACSSRFARSMSSPSSASHARIVSLRSHSPVTLCRNRKRPSTPSSCEKFASRAAPVRTGRVISSPTRPQVPQETYAEFRVDSGAPTIAEAVSWEPTAMTGSGLPIRAARLGLRTPILAPGSISGGRI